MRKITQRLSKHPLLMLLFLGLFIGSNTAYAELKFTGLYYGFQYTNGDFDLDGDDSADDLSESWGFLHGKLGHIINDLVSVEGQLGISTNANADQGVYIYGVFAKIGKGCTDMWREREPRW